MSCRCINCIVPPHILINLAKSDRKELRDIALRTLLTTTRLRGQRSVRATMGVTSPGSARRTIFDCRQSTDLTNARVTRAEDAGPTGDASVNQAFDGLGATRDFYKQIFKRDSLDGSGMRIDGYVHYGQAYNNAFWDGREMVFGDGDRIMFTDFTASIDVIGHELTHGVTEFTAGLVYHKQPGALNESISDVFGSLIKQWKLKQTADQADWLIGAEIFTPDVNGDALRSLKAPGTAYNTPEFGKDPQPAHMDNYDDRPDTEEGDFGGVHINSGIPNHAFYLTATDIGGNAWEAPGHIWYEALKASNANTDFEGFAQLTYIMADKLYGAGSRQQQAVASAWQEVGVRISGAAAARVSQRMRRPNGKSREEESLAELSRQISDLVSQVSDLSRDVSAMRSRMSS